MKICCLLLALLSATCLAAQTKTIPLTDAYGNPVVGNDGKPATVTMSPVEAPPATGPDLSKLPPDRVLVSVGEEKITAGELSSLIQILPEQMRSAAVGANRRQFIENIVKVKVLAQEARKRKLDQTTAYKKQAAFQLENLLAGVLYQDMIKSLQVDEATERAYYEQHKAESERVHARHILVRMKGSPVPVKPGQQDLSEEQALAKAQELRKKLAAGGDFAALAQAESDDTGSGANGGDLGFFGHGQMVPSFEQVAFAMPAGQLSEPVRSQFGYHIIRVEAKEAKTFEQMRPDIEKRIRPEAAQKALEEMRKSAKVVLDPLFFGEEPKPEKKP